MLKENVIDFLNQAKIILISIKDDPVCLGLLSITFLIIVLFLIVIKVTDNDIKKINKIN